MYNYPLIFPIQRKTMTFSRTLNLLSERYFSIYWKYQDLTLLGNGSDFLVKVLTRKKCFDTTDLAQREGIFLVKCFVQACNLKLFSREFLIQTR